MEFIETIVGLLPATLNEVCSQLVVSSSYE
jgi:hypothetical protein